MQWAAIFDVDGTMVDNRHHHEAAWLEFSKRKNLGITAEFYRANLHSRSNAAIVRTLLGPDTPAATIEALGNEKEALYREIYEPLLEEIPGLTALLRELTRAKVPCATVSNGMPDNVSLVLDTLDIWEHFQVVMNHTEVTHGKPDPELFLTAAERLAVPIENCLVFEDSVSGFAAAEAAGAPYVVVTAGADPNELKRARHAVARIRDFTELSLDQMQRWALGQP